MIAPDTARIAYRGLVSAVLALSWQICMDEGSAQAQTSAGSKTAVHGLIVDPMDVSQKKVTAWKNEGFHLVVLTLDERFDATIYQKAAQIIAADSLDLYYWIEVGRNATFAKEHPEWMATLGMHDDWRKQFPNVPKLQKGEVAKAWPWTPIAYEKAFTAHLARIRDLLRRVPQSYSGVLLNDLQGGPSSCGCGNLQCRWAIDYNVPHTAQRVSGNDVAARFVDDVKKIVVGHKVIPVWTSECERDDMALKKIPNQKWTTGYCGGVDCFNYCHDRFAEQWLALQAKQDDPIALLLLHKEFKRDRDEYGGKTAWIASAPGYLSDEKIKKAPPKSLWLVVQGFDVTPEEEAAARKSAETTPADVIILARARIEQSYEPRVMQGKE